MTQQIIDVGANANDGTGEPLRQAFTAVNDNFTQIWTAGPVGSQVIITGNIVTTNVTNLGLTLAGNGIGNITANSTIVPGTAGVYDLGAPNNTFQYIYGDYLVGNGALITGIVANTSYNNSNVAAFLPTYTGNLVSLTGPVVTTANVVAGNIITSGFLGVTGNISGGNITGTNLISSGYVSAAGNINSAGNVSGNYFIGNGALLTGIVATNIAADALTGTTLSSNVLYSSLKVVDNLLYLDVIGNVTTQGRFIGSGAGLTNIPAANVSGQVANALVAGTVYTNAQPNITSVGTLTSLTATGNITGNYILGNGALLTGIATSNINANALVGDTLSSNVLYSSLKVVDDLLYLDVVGNVTTTGRFIGSGAGLTDIPAANVSGQVANALVSGTVYTNAQPNITSVGTLTSLTATGNVTGNYFIGNGALLTGISASNVNANTLVGDTLSSNVLYSSLKIVDDLLYLDVIGNVTTTGRFIGSGAGLTNIPGANVSGPVANATYATTAGTAYSVAGANVSGTVANATYAVDAGNATTAITAITSTYANIANLVAGANVSGPVANATYANTAGLAITATTANTANTVTTAAQPNITSVGTLTSVSVSGNATAGNLLTGGNISSVGNITGNYFIGNGSQVTDVVAKSVPGNALTGDVLSTNIIYSSLKVVDDLLYLDVAGNVTTFGRFIGSGAGLTDIPAGNILGNVANANYATYAGSATTATFANTANSVAGANVTGTVANAAYAVISGTAYSVAAANVSGTVANATYAISAGSATTANFADTANSVAGANVSGTVANATYATNAGSATTAGTVTIAAQPNITSVGTLTSVTVTGDATAGNVLTAGQISAAGNITGDYFIGNGQQLTGVIATSVGNLDSLVVIGNTTTGNLTTGGLISAVGDIRTVGNVSGNYFIGNGALLTGITVAGGTTIVNGNSNVAVNANGNVTVGVTGTSNVSVFTPLGIEVTGLVSATGNIAGNYLLGNGALITGLPAGYSNADVANYLPTYTGNLISLTGPVTTTSNVTGGNVLTSGLISATGNVAGNYILGNGALLTGVITSVANINNGTSNVTVVSSGGNITVGVDGTSNVVVFANTGAYVTGVVSASGNVTGGNVLTGGLISAAANIVGGNIATTGQISATGNITGNYFIGNGSQLTDINANTLVGNTLSSNVLYSSLTTVGTLANLSVTGNVAGGNVLTAGLVSATGNATAGNILTAGVVSAAANVTGGNVLTAGLISATSTITSAADITGANLITSGVVTATGNVTGGNVLTGGLISATGNISGNNVNVLGLVSVVGNVIAGNVNTSAIRPVSGELSITTASGNLNLQPAGNIVLANTIINSVAYPLQDTDVASKIYVDNLVSTAISYHAPVTAATITDLATTTAGTITYTQPNGAANGVGALLTTTGSFNLIDTANIQTVGTRILVQNEANAVLNGVYVWANATNIVRSTDTNTYGAGNTQALGLNDYFFVSSGNINKGSSFIVSAPTGTITFGTSNITFSQFSSSQTYTANTNAGLSLIGTQFNARVDNDTTAFDGSGNIIVKAGANLTTPNIGAATGISLSLTGNVNSGNVNTGGLISATGNATLGNVLTVGLVSAAGNISGNFFIGNGSQLTGVIASGGLGNTIDLGTNSAGALVSNAVTLTTTTSVTNGIALLNQVLGKLVPPSPPAFPNATAIALTGISTYRMANIVQVDNTPGANRAVAAGTAVANVLRVATYATNTIANVGPGDSGTIVAVRNGANVGNVTLNTNASPTANGTYGGNLVITNNFDYNSANANIAAGFWYVFSSRVSGTSAPAGWNELYIADTATANTNTTVWYYDNSSPSAPSFSSTTMTPPGAANLLYSSTIPHYTNNNNFTIAFNVANISGNTYPSSNTLASGSSGGGFAAPASINYNASNIGSNILSSFASASANTTASITTGFGGSSTGPSMSVNNSYSSGTLTLTTALGNTVLWKSGTATAIDESNVVINTTIGTGSGNAYRIINPGTGNNPAFTGSEAAFNSQSSTLQTYDATVVGSGSSGLLKHDQTNYSTGYLPAGPNLSAGRTGTQYFTIKFVRTAVSKFDVKYSGNIAGMWVALPGSVIDSSSSANGWINMAVAYGGAGYPGVNAPGNGSDGCAVGGIVSLNTSVTNNSKTCTFGTVSSSSTATNEIYVRIALTAGQTVTALTLETASN